jgi:hypothetical protein
VRATIYLEQLPIEEAARAGRYAEALQLQEALAVKVEEGEKKREGKPGWETANALHEVAWRALLAREFTTALTAADRAHALLPYPEILAPRARRSRTPRARATACRSSTLLS